MLIQSKSATTPVIGQAVFEVVETLTTFTCIAATDNSTEFWGAHSEKGKVNPKAVDFIGDYVATSNDEYALYSASEIKGFKPFKGHHAGNTKEEMQIDISAYNV